jgi:hypothetical protein
VYSVALSDRHSVVQWGAMMAVLKEHVKAVQKVY